MIIFLGLKFSMGFIFLGVTFFCPNFIFLGQKSLEDTIFWGLRELTD